MLIFQGNPKRREMGSFCSFRIPQGTNLRFTGHLDLLQLWVNGFYQQCLMVANLGKVTVLLALKANKVQDLLGHGSFHRDFRGKLGSVHSIHLQLYLLREYHHRAMLRALNYSNNKAPRDLEELRLVLSFWFPCSSLLRQQLWPCVTVLWLASM